MEIKHSLILKVAYTSKHFSNMAAPNPKAITWIFSYQLTDAGGPSAALSEIAQVAALPFVQYLPLHICHSRDSPNNYIRGIIRCHMPRSLKQLRTALPNATFTPLRGRFDMSVVNSKLKASYRIGELIEHGSIISEYVTPPPTPEAPKPLKRKFDCVDTCTCPCGFNKTNVTRGSSSPR